MLSSDKDHILQRYKLEVTELINRKSGILIKCFENMEYMLSPGVISGNNVLGSLSLFETKSYTYLEETYQQTLSDTQEIKENIGHLKDFNISFLQENINQFIELSTTYFYLIHRKAISDKLKSFISRFPQVDNSKTLFERIREPDLWSPSSEKFGNTALKHMDMISRMDEINKFILVMILSWQDAFSENDADYMEKHMLLPNGYYPILTYKFSAETIIYHVRRICDDAISMLWLKQYLVENPDTEPESIKIDSIGKYLGCKKTTKPFMFTDETLKFLQILNDISNAYKHSFINSDVYLLGRDEAVFFASCTNNNLLNKSHQLRSITVSDLVDKFNLFFKEYTQKINDHISL